jgi:hypothetical protein
MIIYLYNKYFKKNINANPEKKSVNSITFTIDDSDNIKVYFVFDDPSPDSTAKVGDFLYHLSNGHYINYILDILLNISKQQPEHRDYIWNIINSWSLNLSNYDSANPTNDQPIVRPSLFQQHAFPHKTS